jgi:hypothetical protein
MRAALNLLVVGAVLTAAFVHYGNHLPQLKQLAVPPRSKEPNSTESTDNDLARAIAQNSDSTIIPNNQLVTVVSPLQQLMDNNNDNEKPEKNAEDHTPHKPSPSDLIAPSPVGTSGVVLHKTFSVAAAAHFAFVIPAHAATPQLHGHYRSFAHSDGAQVGDQTADVGFLLMNEEQHAEFMNGSADDVLLSLNSSHDQDVNFALPASQSQPLKFYLVFRNAPGESKKIVQADFAVDF